jgi:hypothetical protein
MKSQIALVGIGLAIAAGVAYVELKPTSNNPIAPVIEASAAPTEAAVEAKTPAPKRTVVPPISTPSIPKPTITGGEDDDDEEENDERDEDEDDD